MPRSGTSRTRTTSGSGGRTSSRARRGPSRRSSRRSKSSSAATPPTRSTATSTSASPASRRTGSFPVSVRTRWRRRSRTRARRARGTSRSGRRRRRARTRRGRRRGDAGRPGWHIECSVMAEQHLGPSFEIHGGGLDLMFPHHENEIAQSRTLGHDFAQVWMHNGMLGFVGEKMSKSRGNVVSLRHVIDAWGRETLLVYFLTGHWRKPIDFTDGVLEQARRRQKRFATLSQPVVAGARWRVGTVRGMSRGRLQHAGGAGRAPRLARPRSAAPRSRGVRARVARGPVAPPATSSSSLSSASRRGRARTSPKRTGCARDRRARVGGAGLRRRLPARAS